MPTRLPVLLHRRKSAAAGTANSRANALASESIPARRHVTPGLLRLAARWATRIICLGISRRFHRTVNEDGTQVIDVGEGGTWAEKIAQRFEKSGGVVVGKKRGRIEAKIARPRGGRTVDVGTRRVLCRPGAAVGAIGVARQRRDPRGAGKMDRERQRVFLVRPAAPAAADRDGEFAAGEDH